MRRNDNARGRPWALRAVLIGLVLVSLGWMVAAVIWVFWGGGE